MWVHSLQPRFCLTLCCSCEDHFEITKRAEKKININMALMMVTSVPSRFIMMRPFLLSMADQCYIVMTENPLFSPANIRCSIQRGFIKWLSSHHRFPWKSYVAAGSRQEKLRVRVLHAMHSFIFMVGHKTRAEVRNVISPR